MFNFLNSTFLFAAVAALIPLIIHLFSKRKVKIVEFSSVKHLKAMQKRQVRRLKIRQLLLLLLRMLIILTIVLAFARPTTEGGSIGSHASVTAVILFDNSPSMDRYVVNGNLFEIAKKKATDLLEAFDENDELMLMSNSSAKINENEFGTTLAVSEKINNLAIDYQNTRLTPVFSKLVDVFNEASNLNKELYIISDRQANSLPDSAFLKDIDARIYLVSLPVEDIDNCGITGVDFGGQLILPGHDFDVTAKIKNYSTDDKDNLIASLFIDGNRVAQTDLSLKSEQEESVRFTRSVSRTGFHSGYVELSDDKFTSDNRYYFSFKIPEKSNLLVIDGDKTGQLFKLALTPSENINQYWTVKLAAPDNLEGIRFWEYDVVVLTGAPALDESYINRLKAFLRRGRTLVLTYDGLTDIDFFNDFYAGLTGVTYSKSIDQNFSKAGYYSFESFEVDHPIFSVFGFEKKELPLIKFWTLPEFETDKNTRTLLKFSGNHPALVENDFENGKVISITGPIGPRYSDITAHAFFVPFVSRLIEYAASDLAEYDLSLYLDENLTRSLDYEGALEKYLTIIKPDSSTVALLPEESNGVLILKVNQADIPGEYYVTLSNREIDRFAMNMNPVEGNLSYVSRDRFTSSIGADDYKDIEENVAGASVISQFRYGRELWHIFIWLAIILIVCEVLLSRSSPVEVD